MEKHWSVLDWSCMHGTEILNVGLPIEGVRLRNNKEAGPLPGSDDDTDLPFYECQLNAAQADLSDEFLEVWTKQDGGALAEAPPAELRPAKDHTGWRDPFIFETPTEENGMCA